MVRGNGFLEMHARKQQQRQEQAFAAPSARWCSWMKDEMAVRCSDDEGCWLWRSPSAAPWHATTRARCSGGGSTWRRYEDGDSIFGRVLQCDGIEPRWGGRTLALGDAGRDSVTFQSADRAASGARGACHHALPLAVETLLVPPLSCGAFSSRWAPAARPAVWTQCRVQPSGGVGGGASLFSNYYALVIALPLSLSWYAGVQLRSPRQSCKVQRLAADGEYAACGEGCGCHAGQRT